MRDRLPTIRQHLLALSYKKATVSLVDKLFSCCSYQYRESSTSGKRNGGLNTANFFLGGVFFLPRKLKTLQLVLFVTGLRALLITRGPSSAGYFSTRAAYTKSFLSLNHTYSTFHTTVHVRPVPFTHNQEICKRARIRFSCFESQNCFQANIYSRGNENLCCCCVRKFLFDGGFLQQQRSSWFKV